MKFNPFEKSIQQSKCYKRCDRLNFFLLLVKSLINWPEFLRYVLN